MVSRWNHTQTGVTKIKNNVRKITTKIHFLKWWKANNTKGKVLAESYFLNGFTTEFHRLCSLKSHLTTWDWGTDLATTMATRFTRLNHGCDYINILVFGPAALCPSVICGENGHSFDRPTIIWLDDRPRIHFVHSCFRLLKYCSVF